MPSFLSDNNTPNRNDPEWVILQKILGSLNAISGGGSGGGPFVEVSGDTMTGPLVISANGALSTPAFKLTGAPITGGTATTTKPLVLIETAGATSTAWTTSGTMLGVNSAPGFGGYLLDIKANNASQFLVSTTGVAYSGSGFTVNSSSGYFRIGADLTIRRAATANLALGDVDSASPVAQTISVQNVAAGTTDTAGVNFTINGCRPTGTGLGGEVIIQTANSSTTGSSQNALVAQLRVMPNGGIRIGGGGSSAPWLIPITGNTATTAGTVTTSGVGLGFYSYIGSSQAQDSFAFTGASQTPTGSSAQHVALYRTFAPTSGTASWTMLGLTPTINQTGGANGITRGLYVNPTLTAAADFRALEISDGNIVLPKTVTAAGTTGARTINKLTGTVNFAAGATSLVVTNSYVTTSSIIIATVGTNDATMKSVQAVAGSGSFTLYANAAPTGETRVDFHITN